VVICNDVTWIHCELLLKIVMLNLFSAKMILLKLSITITDSSFHPPPHPKKGGHNFYSTNLFLVYTIFRCTMYVNHLDKNHYFKWKDQLCVSSKQSYKFNAYYRYIKEFMAFDWLIKRIHGFWLANSHVWNRHLKQVT
jgi:hypothetical protein